MTGNQALLSEADEKVRLLKPCAPPVKLAAEELESMRTALALEGVIQVPSAILEKKRFRVLLASGVISGSLATNSQGRRLKNLLKINSEDLHQARSCALGRDAAFSYGLTPHYAVIHIGRPQAFVIVQRVKSSADRQGK